MDIIKIVIADDHKIIRDGIKALLKEYEQMEVVGEAADGEELLDLLTTLEADIVLLDINMPKKTGIDATIEIVEKYPNMRILVLSMLNSESYIAKAIDSGANGYILKNTGKEELHHAIVTVMSGNRYISMDIALELLKKTQTAILPKLKIDTGKETASVGVKYTPREIEVLKLIAEGFTNAEIADKLFTSKRTIETHRQNLIEKTQVKNTAALIRYAISEGIIS